MPDGEMIYDAATGSRHAAVSAGLRQRLSGSGPVVSLAWSPDSRRLALGMNDGGNVMLVEADGGTLLTARTLHTGWVRSVAWHPDGTRLATAGRDGTVKVLDARTLEPLLNFTDHGTDVRAVAWSPDGRRLASAGNDQRLIIRDATGAEIRECSPEK